MPALLLFDQIHAEDLVFKIKGKQEQSPSFLQTYLAIFVCGVDTVIVYLVK